jgi:hypothetical protein
MLAVRNRLLRVMKEMAFRKNCESEQQVERVVFLAFKSLMVLSLCPVKCRGLDVFG